MYVPGALQNNFFLISDFDDLVILYETTSSAQPRNYLAFYVLT